jgi:hypothetical protein
MSKLSKMPAETARQILERASGTTPGRIYFHVWRVAPDKERCYTRTINCDERLFRSSQKAVAYARTLARTHHMKWLGASILHMGSEQVAVSGTGAIWIEGHNTATSRSSLTLPALLERLAPLRSRHSR